jgi:hypothetical protein
MSQFQMRPEITLEEGLEMYHSKTQAAYAALSQKGYIQPNIPTMSTNAGPQPYRGELPQDITTLSDEQLGVYMGLLSEWNAYVQFQLAEADVQLSQAKAALSLTEAKLRISYKTDEESKKRSNPERDDYVQADRRFVEADSNMRYCEAIWRYTKAIAFSAEQAFSAISRRITQRGQDIERNRREGSVTGQTNIPSGPLFAPRR